MKLLSMVIVVQQVTVSSKLQVVIPREVRESMDIQPGTRSQVQLGNEGFTRFFLVPMCNLGKGKTRKK
jgi:AbrB family looped-hinge helix DNA binding protein